LAHLANDRINGVRTKENPAEIRKKNKYLTIWKIVDFMR
jgi:hypothetical protein